VIAELIVARSGRPTQDPPDYAAWWRSSTAGGDVPAGYDTRRPTASSLPQYVIERLARSRPEAIYVAGVGQHQMWAAQFWKYEKPNTWINSGGLGTMGYAVPAAMGAKVGRPTRTVWAIDGDGCFQMTNQELVTCAHRTHPDQGRDHQQRSLGMVRQWQTLFYDERYSNTDLHPATPADPGLRQAGRGDTAASGCAARAPRTSTPRSRRRWAINDRPVVVDFVCTEDAMVWPMVAAGTSNDDIRSRATPPGLGRGGVDDEPQAHAVGAGREQARRAGPRRRACSRRRGFNIDSLAVGPTEHEDVSRMTIVVDVEELPLEQVTKQLNKLINVLKIVELEPAPRCQRELLLVKVKADAETRSHVLETVELFRAKVVDVATDAVTIEATGTRQARGAAAGARAVRHQGARAVRAWSPSAAVPARSPTAACARSTASA
jgi:acetolactate synthase small subunit